MPKRVRDLKKMREYCRRWRKKNLEQERKRTREWAREHPEYRKKYLMENRQQMREYVNKWAAKTLNKSTRNVKRIWDMYRLTPEDRERIREFQASHPVFSILLGTNEATDHNHKTGLIRGVMDWRINMAYGLLEKVQPGSLPSLLRALADYHENPPATQALRKETYGLIGHAKYKKKMVYGSSTGAIYEGKKS
jgi:hypothetical protein